MSSESSQTILPQGAGYGVGEFCFETLVSLVCANRIPQSSVCPAYRDGNEVWRLIDLSLLICRNWAILQRVYATVDRDPGALHRLLA